MRCDVHIIGADPCSQTRQPLADFAVMVVSGNLEGQDFKRRENEVVPLQGQSG